MDRALKRSILPKNKLAIISQTEEGTQYTCVECDAQYNDKEKLEVHLCSHFKEFRFLCGICGTGLKRKEHLDRHTLGHQEVRPHVCPECGKGFKRKEHLNIHRSIHSGDKTQVCSLCHRSFYRKDHLQKHLQTHSKMFMEQNIVPLSDQELMQIKGEVLDDEDVKPNIEENGVGDEVYLEIDEENQSSEPTGFVPKDPQRPYECVVCHKTYKRKDHLKLHAITHLEKDKICSECGKAFHKEEQLLQHMNVHLNVYSQMTDHAVDKMHALIDNSDIDIVPISSPDLLVPRATYTYNPESRPHECHICHRKFKRKQHLKVHANVHLKEQPPTIWCSLCNEGFHNNMQFESHLCPGEAPSEEYVEQASAPQDAKKENSHPVEFVPIPIINCMELQPPKAPEESHIPTPVRVYVCKFCQKPFRRKDHYKIHLHIHTGVKSFFCTECGKGFYRKDHLQKHSQVHQKKPKALRSPPPLYPIACHVAKLKKDLNLKPEITITAPSNTKLRVPLQIKVPYQMVVAMENGETREHTVDPHHYTT